MARTINTGQGQPDAPAPARRGRTRDEMEAGEALILLSRGYGECGAGQRQPQNPNGQAPNNRVQPMNLGPHPGQNMPAVQIGGRPQVPQNVPQQMPHPAMAARQGVPPQQIPHPAMAARQGVPMWNGNGFQYMQPGVGQMPVPLTGQEALQAYLIRQQILAGVAPENLIMMRGAHQQGNQPLVSPLLQITNQGVFAPAIPPPTFNGVFHPFPVMPFQPNGPGASGPGVAPGVPVQFAAHGAPAQGVPAAGQVPVNQCHCAHHRPVMPQAVAQARARPEQPQNGYPQTAVAMGNPKANLPAQSRMGSQAAIQGNGMQPQGTNPTPARTLVEGNANAAGSEQIEKAERARGKVDTCRRRSHETPQNRAEPPAPVEAMTNQANHPGIPRGAVGQNGHRRRIPPEFAHQSRQERPKPSSSSGPNTGQASPNPAVIANDSTNNTQHERNGGGGEIGLGRSFSILKTVIGHPATAFLVLDRLEIDDIINLQLTFRRFYHLVKNNFAVIVMRKASQIAPEGSAIFAFLCYPKLCVVAQKSPGVKVDNGHYLIPSFRWLKMLQYREEVVKDIMRLMAAMGWGVPDRCSRVIKKIWFLMDIPDNRRRTWTVQKRSQWTDADLILAAHFIVQLDMLFTDSHARKKQGCMRRLLLAQPSLTLLCNVLKGTELTTHHETVNAYVRWQYNPPPSEADQWVFGVPPTEVGSLQWEGYGQKERTVKFQRPDTLILKEIANRNLDVEHMYVDNILSDESESNQRLRSWSGEFSKESKPMTFLQAVNLVSLEMEPVSLEMRPVRLE